MGTGVNNTLFHSQKPQKPLIFMPNAKPISQFLSLPPLSIDAVSPSSARTSAVAVATDTNQPSSSSDQVCFHHFQLELYYDFNGFRN